MDIALPALILLALVLPGFTFIHTFRAFCGTLEQIRSNEPVATPMSLEYVLAVLLGVASHFVWTPIASVFGYEIDREALFLLISGNYESESPFNSAKAAVTGYPKEIAAYFFSLYLVTGAAGALLGVLVKRTLLGPSLSNWYFLFSGVRVGASGTLVTVSVAHDGFSCLYAGMLHSYVLQADGDSLDYIVLKAPMFRLKFGEDPKVGADQHEIPGDRFVIWSKSIITINVDYIFVVESSSSVIGQ